MFRWRALLLVIGLALLLAACVPSDNRGNGVRAAQVPVVAPKTDPEPAPELSGSTGCPVTLPPDPPFTPPAPYPDAPVGRFWYGTAALWTMLPTDGMWRQLGGGEKVFWWREGYVWNKEPEPELAAIATRLDAPAAIVKSLPATNAYYATNVDHPVWISAMLTGLRVPVPGCWEVSGIYHGHELSFIVWVAP